VDENEEAADLIDLAASVVVLNSGLGLAALAKGKPVVCCGEAFYAQPGLACTVSEREALVAAVKEASLPDEDRRLSFLRYLIEDFYSFGASDQVPSSAGGTTNRILFSVIRGLTEAPIALGQVPGNVSLKAPLYLSFGGRDGVQEETKAINTFIRMGSAACEKGEYDEALRLFAIANRRQLANKNLSRAMTEAGKVAHAAGERDEAARLFETARRWVPDGRGAARTLIELAKAVRLAGDYEDADRLFEIAYRWLPEDRNLHKLLLETGVQRHGGPLADWMILPAGKLSEKAREAFAAGDYKKATQLFEALRTREPDEVEHLRCLAECYLKRGADALALECLDEALKHLPENKRLQRRRRDAALPQWLRRFFPGRPFLP
jgi:tetratricopeptide (TPR) repeat protein